MSICCMGESGLVMRLVHAQCSVITEDGFFQDRDHILVYMESYCISVVCKLQALRPEATPFFPPPIPIEVQQRRARTQTVRAA